MKYEEIVNRVAGSTGYSQRLVDRTYMAYWKAVKMYIESLPLKDDLSDEEFAELRPNVNIPSIGKLYVTLNKYHRIKKQYSILEQLNSKKHGTTH